MTGRITWVVAAAIAATTWPADAAAHAFAPRDGLIAGLAHPLGGWDHLLAMVLVGMLSTRLQRRDLWALPATFVGVMVLAAGAGMKGWIYPGLEAGISLSVVVLGLLLIARAGPRRLVYSAVAVFAALHGAAHGLEAPVQAAPGLYVAGFASATAALHAVGVFVALLCDQERWGATAVRGAGAAAALAGTAFVLA